MRELIHLDDHRGQLHCDNPKCGHDLAPGEVTWGEHLIGYPCPVCNHNMLTQADYEGSERVYRVAMWLNKWFGWLGGEYDPTNPKWKNEVTVHHHAGKTDVKIERID